VFLTFLDSSNDSSTAEADAMKDVENRARSSRGRKSLECILIETKNEVGSISRLLVGFRKFMISPRRYSFKAIRLVAMEYSISRNIPTWFSPR